MNEKKGILPSNHRQLSLFSCATMHEQHILPTVLPTCASQELMIQFVLLLHLKSHPTPHLENKLIEDQ
jgi:hypothetical protein